MSYQALPAQAQPFLKLAQANMEALTRFSSSPEVMSQASSVASQFFQQASASSMKLAQTGAYAQLMQVMLKNYTEFLGELGQSGMTMLSQGHAAFTQQAQQAADTAINAAQVGGRRSRQAA